MNRRTVSKSVSGLFHATILPFGAYSIVCEVKKTMNTKLIVALVIVGVLAVAVVGLVSAQLATPTASPNGAAPNATPADGFFGWVGRCFGFRNSQYYGTGAPAVQAPLAANITVTDPNTGQTTNYQGYYGYGGCMRGFFP